MPKATKRLARSEPFVEHADDHLIICRCEEITKGEIRRAVYDGLTTMNEVKRFLRSGMGLCQGQTCNRLVRSIIAKELALPIQEIEVPAPRSPVRVISMRTYANDNEGQ